MCGLSGVPPFGSIPLVALRTPAGTGCARPSNPCRASICHPLLPQTLPVPGTRSAASSGSVEVRSLRLSKGRCRSCPPVPEALEGSVSKSFVTPGLAIVSFSGSPRESVKDKIRHSWPQPGICKIKKKSPTLDEPHF